MDIVGVFSVPLPTWRRITDSVGDGLAHNMMQPTLFAGNVFMLARFV